MPSFVVYEAFTPAQLREEQNLEGLREPLGRPKRTISCTQGWGVYSIRAGPVIPCGLKDTTPQSGP